jgi:hypothetical protein
MVSSTNLVVCLLTSFLGLYKTEAFAGQKGWTNRPVFPELAKTPDAEVETSSAKREKWDLMRFLSQSSKFISMPKPPLPGANRPIPIVPGELIWSSASGAVNGVDSSSGDKPKMNFNFAPLDDVVMGGVSSSTFTNGKWSGVVSDNNSGGFVGIRSTPFAKPLDLSACQGVQLKLKGSEGKVFKAVVRDSTDFNGVCWTTAFRSGKPKFNLFKDPRADAECVVQIPFDDLIPTIFARTVPDQKLNKKTIQAFQIAFSKFLFDGELNEAFSLGVFELELIELRAY